MPDLRTIAASYSRVSSLDQVTDALTIKGSLEEQASKAESYIQKQGWSYLGDYREEGISGEKFEERVALQRMLEDARLDKFQILVIKAGDRLARDQEVFFKITKILNQYYNIQILNLSNPSQIVAPEEFTGRRNPMLIVQQGFDAMMAAFDQARRSEMMIEGKRRQARAGRYMSPTLFYGYQLEFRIVNGVRVERIPVPDPAEYWVLELLPHLILEERLSEKETIVRLERLGARPRKAEHWSRSSLAAMVRQPFYGGKVAFGRRVVKMDKDGKNVRPKAREGREILSDHKYEHPWSWATYQAMQQVRADRATHPPRQGVSRSPLAGLLVCGFCGHNMLLRLGSTTGPKKRKDRFVCGYHEQTPAACQVNDVPGQLVLADLLLVCQRLKEDRAADPQKFYAGLEVSDNAGRRILIEKKIKEARKELDTSIPKKIDRLNRGYLNGNITDEQYADMSRMVGQERDLAASTALELEGELRKLVSTASQVEEMDRFVNEFDEFEHLLQTRILEWPEGAARRAKAWLSRRYQRISVRSRGPGVRGFEITYEVLPADELRL